MSEKQLSFEGAMMIVNGNRWIQLKDIEKLSDFMIKQQATITALQDEIVQLKRQNKALKDSSLTDAYFDYLENSRTFTLKEAEEPIRVTKYEELFDDE